MGCWQRSTVALFSVMLAAPGFAQAPKADPAQDGLRLPHGTSVTLDLRRVPANEAVARLAEASGADLACAAALAQRKVTVVARDDPAGKVGDCLALSVGGRWRQAGARWTLEPAEPAQLLSAHELVSDLRWVLLPPDGREELAHASADTFLAPFRVLGALLPNQKEAAQSADGLRLAELPPAARQQILGIFHRQLYSEPDSLRRDLQLYQGLDSRVVTLHPENHRLLAFEGTPFTVSFRQAVPQDSEGGR